MTNFMFNDNNSDNLLLIHHSNLRRHIIKKFLLFVIECWFNVHIYCLLYNTEFLILLNQFSSNLSNF